MNAEFTTRRSYTVDEVARALQVSPMTIRREVKRGEIRATRVGRQIRIGEIEMRRLLGDTIDATESKDTDEVSE